MQKSDEPFNLIADIGINKDTGAFDQATVFLFNPENSRIPTRRFSGKISSSWELIGNWEDLPWRELFVNEFQLDVYGNAAVSINKDGTSLSGPFGRPSKNMVGYKLIEPDVFSYAYQDDRYTLERDYTGSVLGSCKISNAEMGMFHGRVLVHYVNGLAYEGNYSPATATVTSDIVVIGSEGQRYNGWIENGKIFWNTPTYKKSIFEKVGRELDRVFKKDIEANVRKARKDFCEVIHVDHCSFNGSASIDSNGNFTLGNNQTYTPPQIRMKRLEI